MAKIQCKMCGGDIELHEGVLTGECPYCGTLTTFPKISNNDDLANLYNRAEHFRRNNEYDKAVSAYEKIVEANPDDAEAYWGIVISKFGIEYVEDPVSHERIPTCHRVHYESILADQNFLTALEKAGNSEKALYEAEARRIAEIQKGILAISNNEQPFDVFICYKESDSTGNRTKDSVTAQEIYYQLTNAGYKVFFARITLESKLGQQYEPYIFAALNSAKVMLVIGSAKEYFEAVWVRNEWSRFLSLMKNDRSKLLIPCYKDMDAYDIPEALSLFQAQDMGKIGFIQDLLHGIKKVVDKTAPAPAPAAAAAPAAPAGGDVKSKDHPFLQRAKLFVETADFDSAKGYCEKMLDLNPQSGWAYFYRLLAEVRVCNENYLVNINGVGQHKSFQLARRFADDELAKIMDGVINAQKEAWQKAAEAERRRAEEMQQQQNENIRLRSEANQRYEFLNYYLTLENKLNGKSDIFKAIIESLNEENALRNAAQLLTASMAAPVQIKTDALVNSLPDIKILQAAIKRRKRKRFLIVSSVISVIIIAVSLYFAFPYIRGYKLDGETLVEVTDKDCTEFTIPDGVTTIGFPGFVNCSNLTSVTIPDSVTTIGDAAFAGCSSLTEVKIPDSVTTIGNRAFSGCSSLTTITIPDGVTYIGSETFSGCTSLTSITIPNSVTAIHTEAFYGCTSLTSITIPDSVGTIGNGAFDGCTNLTSITAAPHCLEQLPKSIKKQLTTIIIPDGVTVIEERAFTEYKNLTSITIPDGVTSIGYNAFWSCKNLTSVEIPDSVTSIGDSAFGECYKLKTVVLPKNCTYGKYSFPYGCEVIRR